MGLQRYYGSWTHLCWHTIVLPTGLPLHVQMQEMNYPEQEERIINEISTYLNVSGKRTHELSKLATQMGLSQKKIVKSGKTRWLSRDRAVASLLVCYAALVSQFGGDTETLNAAIIHQHLTSFSFVSVLVFMSDLLPLLAKLSAKFQADDVDYSQVHRQLENTRSAILRNYLCYDSNENEDQPQLSTSMDYEQCVRIWNELHEDGAAGKFMPPSGPNLDGFLQEPSVFKGVELSVKPETEGGDAVSEFGLFAQKFAIAVLSRLAERFPDTDMEMLALFEIFNPTKIPFADVRKLRDYGKSELRKLIDFYGKTSSDGVVVFQPLVDGPQLLIEWSDQLDTFAKHAKSGVSRDEMFRIMLTDGSLDTSPNLHILICIAMVHMLDTAPCERGFSAMKRIKSALRSRLYVETLDALMRISMLGPTYTDSPEDVTTLVDEAYVMWTQMCKRDPRNARFGNKNAAKKKRGVQAAHTEIPNPDGNEAGIALDEAADEIEEAEATEDTQNEGSLESDEAADPYAAVADFDITGWVRQPQPQNETELKQALRKSNVKIAYKFLTGWEVGTYKKKGTKTHKHEHVVSFKVNGVSEPWYRVLDLSEYGPGTSKMWMIVKKN